MSELPPAPPKGVLGGRSFTTKVVAIAAAIVALSGAIKVVYQVGNWVEDRNRPTTTPETTAQAPVTVVQTTTPTAATTTIQAATTAAPPNTTVKPGYQPLYQPTTLVLSSPGCNETYIDLTVPKVYVKSNGEEGQVYYSICYNLTDNAPHLNTVEPAVAAFGPTGGTPTPEACAALVDQEPISGRFGHRPVSRCAYGLTRDGSLPSWSSATTPRHDA